VKTHHSRAWIPIAAAAIFFLALPVNAAERIRVATLYIGSSMLPLLQEAKLQQEKR
jgi:hypothetical protein